MERLTLLACSAGVISCDQSLRSPRLTDPDQPCSCVSARVVLVWPPSLSLCPYLCLSVCLPNSVCMMKVKDTGAHWPTQPLSVAKRGKVLTWQLNMTTTSHCASMPYPLLPSLRHTLSGQLGTCASLWRLARRTSGMLPDQAEYPFQ